MPLPKISPLQFLILHLLEDGDKFGREVREKLAEAGERKSGPAFYQLMGRLEESGLVKGQYDQRVVDSQIIRERHYRITGDGSRAMNDTRDFFLARRRLGIQSV